MTQKSESPVDTDSPTQENSPDENNEDSDDSSDYNKNGSEENPYVVTKFHQAPPARQADTILETNSVMDSLTLWWDDPESSNYYIHLPCSTENSGPLALPLGSSEPKLQTDTQLSITAPPPIMNGKMGISLPPDEIM